jgi:hypothetical protein
MAAGTLIAVGLAAASGYYLWKRTGADAGPSDPRPSPSPVPPNPPPSSAKIEPTPIAPTVPSSSAGELPPTAGRARDRYVVEAVRSGRARPEWAKVTSRAGGHEAVFEVSRDALLVDGVRVGVSARVAQEIADLTGASLLTTKLLDLMWEERGVTLLPMPRGQAEMTTTREMRAYSAGIEKAIERAGGSGIVQTLGKAWVLDDRLAEVDGRAKTIGGVPVACNYGWHFSGGSFQGIAGERATSGDARVIQGPGFHHDLDWTDYSQVCLLARQACVVDGRPATLAEVLTSPELAPLASARGAVRVTRQPGVRSGDGAPGRGNAISALSLERGRE